MVLLGLAGNAVGQRYLTHTYAEADGLQSSTVHSVVQDRDGCMWFATRAGVASYDGSTWESYGAQDGLIAPSQAFVRLDDEGTLWTVGAVTGINLAWFEEGTWHTLPHHTAPPPRQDISAFEVLTIHDRPFAFVGSSAGQLHVWDGAGWTTLALASLDRFSGVTGIVAWRDELLISTRRGLFALPQEALGDLGQAQAKLRDGRVLFPELPEGAIIGLCTMRDGNALWVVGNSWIGSLDEQGFTELEGDLPAEVASHYPYVVAEADEAGGLYLGNPSALLYYHPDSGLELLDISSGLIAGGATSVFFDRENNTWITGLRGVTKLVSRRFASLTSEHGLHADEVTAILERADGGVVLGHPGGLTFLEEETRTVELTDVPLMGRVLDLAEDVGGNIWAAANVLGLAEIGPDLEVRWHFPGAKTGESISAVHRDASGQLWAGGSFHLYKRVGSSFEVVELPRDRERRTMIRRITEGADGTIYVGTFGAEVFRVRGEEIDRWDLPEENTHNGVYTILEQADGTVLVGSGTGLWQIRDDVLQRPLEGDPRIERPIYQIVEDELDQVWFGTDNGVLRWNGRDLEHLTARHGLIGAETNRAGGLLDSQGRVWIGMDHGVSIYHADHELERPFPPTVELLWADVGGRLFPLDEEMGLGHDENTLIFRYRAISFVDEERTQFRVWLEGFDEAGASTIERREVRYTNLSPGEYRLHVRAVDPEGRESAEVVSAPIVVARPLWMQPWFAVLAFALVGAVVFGVLRHLAQRDYARRLESEVRGRTAELRASEEAMAGEKERLSVTLASIADGVATTDGEGKILLWNEAAARLMGLPPEEARGRALGRVLQLAIEPVLQEGRVVQESVLMGSSHGDTRRLMVSGAPIVGREGRPTGSVFAFRDVTDQSRREKEQVKTQRLEALGVLAGGIAHDFNNLLTIVLGGLSMLESDGRLGTRGLGIVRDVEGATIRARSLTEQLMTFSRGGAPVRRAASVADVIRETASFALRGANVRAHIELPRDLWVVEIDEGQISQVLNNLLINARQAMPEGGSVAIQGRNLQSGPAFVAPGRYVEIRVADEGSGIAPEHLDHVFDPYFSTKEEGSGLGLATAHSIVEKHEGRLTVDSQPGCGATFCIYLPASMKAIQSEDAPPASSPRGSGRVLVMDDDHNVRRTIQNMVEALGYETRGAADGAEALALYSEGLNRGARFDVVLMDLTVPGGMGGKEAIGRLKDMDPEAVAIVVSGYSTDPVLADHAAHGFRERLDKPFVLEDLARVLEHALGGARSRG